MQAKKTTYIADRGRSNIRNKSTTVACRTNIKQNTAVTKSQAKEPPEVDTRTAEEIDASYKRNLALFNATAAKFEEAYARKMEEIKGFYGENIAGKIETVVEESKHSNFSREEEVKKVKAVFQNGVKLNSNNLKGICNCGPTGKAHQKADTCE